MKNHKFQITKIKQITMTEIQNPKQGYDISPATKLVIPAVAERRAGIQKKPCYYWILAFAGMTIK